MKALPLLAILKIITTSRNFTQKNNNNNKQPTNKQTNQRVIQDKLCILCMVLHNLPGRERGKKNFLGTSSILAWGKSRVGLPPLFIAAAILMLETIIMKS